MFGPEIIWLCSEPTQPAAAPVYLWVTVGLRVKLDLLILLGMGSGQNSEMFSPLPVFESFENALCFAYIQYNVMSVMIKFIIIIHCQTFEERQQCNSSISKAFGIFCGLTLVPQLSV